MSGIAEIATVMMSAAQRRMAVTAANLSNVSTPSYQARRVYSRIVDLRTALPLDSVAIARAGSPAGLKATGNALDIAVEGGAGLLLREGDGYVAVNSAQLQRSGDGVLVDAAGRALQAAGGGDVAIGAGTPAILRDGTVLVDGQAVTRIGLFRTSDGPAVGDASLLPEPSDQGAIIQGFVAPSNVEPAEEMIALTKASRMAETGARVFQIYDDLLGRATNKLGDLGR